MRNLVKENPARGLRRVGGGEIRLVRDVLDVLHAYQVNEPAICFLTELVDSSQRELLIATQDAKGFKVLL
jgi:hypothetical protein